MINSIRTIFHKRKMGFLNEEQSSFDGVLDFIPSKGVSLTQIAGEHKKENLKLITEINGEFKKYEEKIKNYINLCFFKRIGSWS